MSVEYDLRLRQPFRRSMKAMKSDCFYFQNFSYSCLRKKTMSMMGILARNKHGNYVETLSTRTLELLPHDSSKELSDEA